MPLSVADFVRKWKISSLTELQGSQSHFIDLCEMLGLPSPTADDPSGERFCFNKHLSKVYGGKGFADVWKRGFFAWEYKGKHKDLDAAYRQLNDYREDLGNPPLLVVCDLDRFKVHTNFENTNKRVYAFNLDDLNRNQITATCPLPPLDVLRALFGDYSVLRPNRTDAFVTQEAAKLFARLAERLEIERGLTATKIEIAHFLMRILFCLFADAIGLLPKHVFRRLIDSDDRFLPRKFLRKLTNLFEAMSERDGIFGEHTIKFFNGNLFDGSALIELDLKDLETLHKVATQYDWAHVAPAIFGTLFERSLDPKRRSLIGAHYTSEEDILLLIEPVVMRPLEQRWRETRDQILALTAPGTSAENAVILSAAKSLKAPAEKAVIPSAAKDPDTADATHTARPFQPRKQSPRAAKKAPQAQPSLLHSNQQAEDLLAGFFDYLSAVRVLDPACGSGNFLYVALRRLLDLWKEARDFAVEQNIQLATKYAVEKMVSPAQLFGIETDFYAHQLASIVVWIGFLQWKHEHGVLEDREPILQKLSNIEHDDAVMRYDADGKPYEPQWKPTDFIIGNPPFLGGKLLRRELGDTYIDNLFRLYEGRVRAESDLVVYWFEKARAQMEAGNVTRVGLLATQGIRGGANRAVLQRIQETGTIFWAWSDRDWTLAGANVHVSMVAFDRTEPEEFLLDGVQVPRIHADLTSETNTADAFRLPENQGICFMGTTKVGAFDIDETTARKMLSAPLNPNGRPNSDVVRPWVNASDISGRSRGMHIIDFGIDLPEKVAALYELPFEYLKHHAGPDRRVGNRDLGHKPWWLHGRPRPDLRTGLSGLKRFIGTTRVSKHRLFAWLPVATLPDSATFAFAREDDYFFGVLHSTAHELWTRAQGTQLREVESGFRYTPNSTFDTFPFPWPPGTEPSESASPIVFSIAEAARSLVRLRDAWLNPPGASEADLKSRTLTNLYNLRPEWLANAHRALDEAVFAAYGWPANLEKQEILSRLLALNHERASRQAAAPIKKKAASSKASDA